MKIEYLLLMIITVLMVSCGIRNFVKNEDIKTYDTNTKLSDDMIKVYKMKCIGYNKNSFSMDPIIWEMEMDGEKYILLEYKSSQYYHGYSITKR